MRDSEAASVTVGVNVLETKLVVFSLSAAIAGFAGAFFAMEFKTLSNAQGFEMIAGLPLVLALVIGGVGFVAGALFAGVFGFATLWIQDNWHISLWIALFYLAPGLAVLGIIQNPSGAVVPIGEGFARLLPWRKDAETGLRGDRPRPTRSPRSASSGSSARSRKPTYCSSTGSSGSRTTFPGRFVSARSP